MHTNKNSKWFVCTAKFEKSNFDYVFFPKLPFCLELLINITKNPTCFEIKIFLTNPSVKEETIMEIWKYFVLYCNKNITYYVLWNTFLSVSREKYIVLSKYIKMTEIDK